MSNSHLPPVPPANQAPLGGSANPGSGDDVPPGVAKDNGASKNRNLGIQGRQGNIRENTTNKGHQQDR